MSQIVIFLSEFLWRVYLAFLLLWKSKHTKPCYGEIIFSSVIYKNSDFEFLCLLLNFLHVSEIGGATVIAMSDETARCPTDFPTHSLWWQTDLTASNDTTSSDETDDDGSGSSTTAPGPELNAVTPSGDSTDEGWLYGGRPPTKLYVNVTCID